MKKAFSTKLLSLFVLVLTVAALVVVSSAATVWEAADGTGVVTTGEIAGAELDVLTTADNGDGTYTVVFDVVVKDGYMIEDYDLHDGYIPLEPVVVVKELQADGSFNRVVIEKVEKGDYAGYYVVKNWNVDCDIEVECVKPVKITIDGANYEDLTFEQDGHIYVLNKFANYANIVILNSKTDWTKANVDGLEVDDYGHIVDYYNGGKSYFASVYVNNTFANMEGATLTFAYGQGFDGANNSGEANNAVVSADAWFAGRFLVFAQADNQDFVNNGTINVETRSVYMNVKNFINNGTINVTKSSQTSNQLAKLYVNLSAGDNAYDRKFTNNGLLNLEGGSFYLGSARPVYDAANNTMTTVGDAWGHLVNNAEINVQGSLNARSFENAADATIKGSILTYTNAITGKNATVKPQLYVDSSIALTSVNKGLIDFVSDGNMVLYIMNLTNSGTFKMEAGEKGSAIVAGLLKNSGEFTYHDVDGGFTLVLNYGGHLTETNVDLAQLKKLVNGEYSEYTRFRVYAGVNDDAAEMYDTDDGNFSVDYIIPLGIQNTGDMSITGYSHAGSWKFSTFTNNGGKIVNDGTLTIDKLYENPAETQMLFTKLNIGGVDSTQYQYLTYGLNSDIYNNGTLNIGGSVGNDFHAPYLYNAEGATLNINGKYYVDGQRTRLALDTEENEQVAYTSYGELLNYGTVNVAKNGAVENFGDVIVGGVINLNGTFNNYNWTYVQKSGEIVINGIYNNGDADHVCDGSLVKCNHIGLLEIAGTVTNNSKLVNDWNSDIRVEGALDNVNGKITNCGIIVNVGTFTTTVEGLDNQFAINGYDVTYVNKAETEAPADSDEDTKAPADDNAADTQAPTKTPAAQTSDIAVAGLAIIATLSLAGVVVAKKVR